MQDKDPFAFQFKQKPVKSKYSSVASLITLERSQKLDLLIHLISNLSQSLVISGPKGIGKTTLLSELTVQKQDVWPICMVQASGNLSFESFQNQILKYLTQTYSAYKSQELVAIVSSIEKQNQKIVILIDDAGQLVPGLVSSLIQYAATSESLRLVIALTPDELHLKSSSDNVIDDCHFIEIPPLTEKQCGVYLQNLSGKSDAVISFGAINERLIERVYQKTHGIPGGIVSELPEIYHYRTSGSYGRLAGIVFFTIIVAIALKVFVLDESNEKESIQIVRPVLVKKTAVKIEITPPVISVDEPEEIVEKLIELKKPEIINENDQGKKLLSIIELSKQSKKAVEIELIDEKIAVKSDTIKERIVLNEVKVSVKEELIAELLVEPKLENKIDGREWVLKQSAKKYTIQLMVLSSRKAVDKFIRDNQGLKKQLKFFQQNKQNQKYVLIYGSFKNTVSAAKEMKSLPVKYKKSWIRRFSALQKGIKK